MDGFKAYKYYMAIKLHFTKDNFDVFKNRGNVKGTREAFNARNDRYLFDKLARKFPIDREMIQFFVANFAYGNDNVHYAAEEAQSNFLEWTRRKQSMTKIFTDDCHRIVMQCYKDKLKENQIFYFTSNTYPSILKMYLGGQISIETVRILDDMMHLVENWKQNSSMVILWENEIRKIEKLAGFVKYDKTKVEQAFKHFKEELSEFQNG